jgi:DNA-binding transcriptional ArsR family regulator
MREDKKIHILEPGDEYVALAAEVFSLLSDATRIRIILALRDGELSVNELAERAGKSPTVVSQHLAKLRWGKVVKARQERTRVFYSLIDEHAGLLVQHAVYQAEHVVDGVPRHHLTGMEDPQPLGGDGRDDWDHPRLRSEPQPNDGDGRKADE